MCVFADEQKLTCTFEQGMCFWRQQQDEDNGDWVRARGARPPTSGGPGVDHTLGNSSGESALLRHHDLLKPKRSIHVNTQQASTSSHL